MTTFEVQELSSEYDEDSESYDVQVVGTLGKISVKSVDLKSVVKAMKDAQIVIGDCKGCSLDKSSDDDYVIHDDNVPSFLLVKK